MGINCSIFLYRNSLGASQRLELRIVQFSGSSSRQCSAVMGFDTIHVMCTDLLCVVCIGLLAAEFSTVDTGMGG